MKRHYLVFGAHPDDCEISVGGTAAKLAACGDKVKFVSVTNGNKGHFADEYVRDPNSLIERRMAEARAGAEAIGAEFECLGVDDGEVFVTHELTERIVKVIREFGSEGTGPDLVMLNRPTDYHRDHRYTAQSVLDASYVLTVPLYSHSIRHLDRMPVFAYWADQFSEGGDFRADVVVPIDDVFETKLDGVAAHVSQFFEWLPFNAMSLDSVPDDDDGRRSYLRNQLQNRARRVTEWVADSPARERAGECEFVEAFQISEYGRQPSTDDLAELFPVQ